MRFQPNILRGYQMSGDLERACKLVQTYAIEHARDVFRYLTGSIDEEWGAEEWEDSIPFGGHGWEMDYSPELICPVTDGQ